MLYFDFRAILVHGSFDDSSHFVHVNINILTHTTSGRPVLSLITRALYLNHTPHTAHSNLYIIRRVEFTFPILAARVC